MFVPVNFFLSIFVFDLFFFFLVHQRAILLWMHDPAGRDATVVRKALSGDVIGLQVATEVICSRTSSQIQVFKQAYYARYGLHLENDIDYQASGDHQKVTFTLSSCLEV